MALLCSFAFKALKMTFSKKKKKKHLEATVFRPTEQWNFLITGSISILCVLQHIELWRETVDGSLDISVKLRVKKDSHMVRNSIVLLVQMLDSLKTYEGCKV